MIYATESCAHAIVHRSTNTRWRLSTRRFTTPGATDEATMPGHAMPADMLPLLFALACALTAEHVAAAPPALPPSGALLWSNVSEAGMGQDFESALLLPCGDVLLPIPDCDAAPCTVHLGRLRPSTGEHVWRFPQPPDAGAWSLALAGADVAVVSTSQRSSSPTAVRAYNATSGQLLWEKHRLSLGDSSDKPFAVSTSAFLGAGAISEPPPHAGVELGVRAIALSVKDGSVLLNATVANDNTTSSACARHGDKQTCQRHGCAWNPTLDQCQGIDWYPRSAALVDHGSHWDGALIGTEVSEIDSGAGFIVALDFADGRTRWIARNVTAAHMYVVETVDVVVASVDTASFLGQESHLAMLRGYSLDTGKMLWERTTQQHGSDPRGEVTLGRAVDLMDCSWDGPLVAAGAFGAIDPLTGQTIHNFDPATSTPPLANQTGVFYYVQPPQPIGHTLSPMRAMGLGH